MFLDFDGVLHRGTTGTFRKMPLLDQLMVQVPQLAIVLSTNWRLSESLEALREIFMDPITQARVIDVLPELPSQMGHRQREIELWLRQHPDVQKYVALDDSLSLFDPNWGNLHAVDPREGLTSEDISNLVLRFS